MTVTSTSFSTEIRALGERLRTGQDVDDKAHFNKLLRCYYILFVCGHATLNWYPNALTILCLSTASFVRWTLIAHHVCHGGYDFTTSYNRKTFAIGSITRRMMDWFDWILPEAWNVEHGRLHHYSLNESNDPDLVERNMVGLRKMNVPIILKYIIIVFLMCTWKWFYYASNTYSYLLRGNRDGTGEPKVVTLMSIVFGNTPSWWKTVFFVINVMAPFFIGRFILLPIFVQYMTGAGYNALMNIIVAEICTNIHAFIMIAPNHCGEDLTRFDTHCDPMSDDFYKRQVLGSTDFLTGGDFYDFLHGFLNYQIEHHLWPDLSALSYKRAHHEVKSICERHGVSFIQEHVLMRVKKTIDVMTGATSMKRVKRN